MIEYPPYSAPNFPSHSCRNQSNFVFLASFSHVNMAVSEVFLSIVTLTTTAASILGIIKRRCGASQSITQLTKRGAELVKKKRKLLKIRVEGAQLYHDTHVISKAPNHRREEFEGVQKNLKIMNRRTKRTHPVDHTESYASTRIVEEDRSNMRRPCRLEHRHRGYCIKLEFSAIRRDDSGTIRDD